MTMQNTQQPVIDKYILDWVFEEMPVFDVTDREIGRVAYVHLAGEMLTKPELEKLPINYEDISDETLERMVRSGFIVISMEFLKCDCYALSRQIATVIDRGVYLRVSQDELLRA